MKLEYDPKNNIAYMSLRSVKAEVITLSLSDQLNVDIAPDGTIYGIEFMNANEQLRGEDKGDLVVVNNENGKSQHIALS